MPSKDLFNEVLAQMKSMKLNILLENLSKTLIQNTWNSELCAKLFSYQEEEALCDLFLVCERSSVVAAKDTTMDTTPSTNPAPSTETELDKDRQKITTEDPKSALFTDINSSAEEEKDQGVGVHACVFVAVSGYLQKNCRVKGKPNRAKKCADSEDDSGSDSVAGDDSLENSLMIQGIYNMHMGSVPRRLWHKLAEYVYQGKTDVLRWDLGLLGRIGKKLDIPMLEKAVRDAVPIETPEGKENISTEQPMSC